MKKVGKIDHSRGLCGKPDVSGMALQKEVEKNPAHCLCCGTQMKIVPPVSTSLEQLGTYALICPFCPKHEDQDLGGEG